MGINRGKQFEDKLKEQFETIPNISIDRLYDVTTGFKNQNNICDFIVFKEGTLNYFECKAIHGSTLNFKSHIRDNQWEGLLKKSYIGGINAGIICWFIDFDKTIFIPIQSLQILKEENFKSFNCRAATSNLYKELGVWSYEIEANKKRVFFEYDLELFLEEISYE